MTDQHDLSAQWAALALNEARLAHAQRRLGDAARLYARAIEMAPKQQPARHLLGMLQAEMGRFDQAGATFQQALALDENQAPVWRALAEAQLQAGLSANAVASLERAHALQPQDAGILDRLAIALRDHGNEAGAQEKFELALGLAPNNAQILCNYANLLMRLDRVGDALAIYRKAVDLAQSDPAAQVVVLTNRARALSQVGQTQQALEDCDAALALQPAAIGALLRRAEVLADQGKMHLAIEAARQAQKLAPASTDAQALLTSLLLRDENLAVDALQTCEAAYTRLVGSRFAANPDGPGTARLRGQGMAPFRLKHDVAQAQYLRAQGAAVPGIEAFLTATRSLDINESGDYIHPTEAQLQAMLPFLQAPWLHPAQGFAGPCLNAGNDWPALEQAYLDGKPELVAIDNFLSEPALQWFRAFCLCSRVWQTEYKGKYLGAFAVNGFVSPLHLQLAQELRLAMPRVFGAHELMHLWAFKYDTHLGTGINMHADFALVNLNFWITPDEYCLNPASGGMVVYDKPAPKDWSFHQYNSGGDVITQFLKDQGAKPMTVAYRCNRAVLFNSALFHETDRIAFKDVYEGRRINMTYLFGRQLR